MNGASFFPILCYGIDAIEISSVISVSNGFSIDSILRFQPYGYLEQHIVFKWRNKTVFNAPEKLCFC